MSISKRTLSRYFIALCFMSLTTFISPVIMAQETPFAITQMEKEILSITNTELDSMLALSEQYLTKAKTADWTLGKLYANYYMGYVYVGKNDLKLAEPFLRKNLDVLAQLPSAEKADSLHLTIEGKTLNKLANVYYKKGQLDSVVHYATLAQTPLEKANRLKDVIVAKNYLAAVHYRKGELQKAGEIFKACYALNEQMGNLQGMGYIANNLTVLYKSSGKLTSALKYGFKSLEISRKMKRPRTEIATLVNISQIYYQLKEYRNAVSHLTEAYSIAQSIENENSLADVSNDLGDNYRKLGVNDSASYYYQQSLALFQKIESEDNVAYVCERISSFLLEQGKLEEAKTYIEKGLAITKKIDIPYDETLLYCSLIEYYLEKKQHQQAFIATQHLLQLIAKTEDYDLQKTAYGVIHKAYHATGRKAAAYDYLQQYMAASDSINNTDQSREFARLEYQFELKQETQRLEAEKVQQQLVYQQEIERQQWIQHVAFGVIFFVLIIARILYRSTQRKQKDNQQLSHQAEMLTQKNEELQVLREKEQQMMEQERAFMEESIANKERQLATTTMFSHERNAILNQLLDYFKELKSDVSTKGFRKIIEATKLIQSNVNVQNSWENFVYQFENVHPKFFQQLKDQYPDISSAELKTAAYIKIGLRNKEIAQIANMSPEAVKKGLYRLKKRLALKAQDDLRSFIFAFGK